jgi:putative membrane protein
VPDRLIPALWTLLAIYVAARPLQAFPDRVPMLAIVFLHVVPPALFAMVHGAVAYRVRGILVFAALCLGIGNLFENLGILTGFPFGSYSFTEVMGPRILNVPVLLGLAYLGMGYLSWTLARLILKDGRVFTLPLLASCIMVAWDLSMEPVWATLVHGWIWWKGGPYFGVPVSNFLGWYLTVYVFYQLFALYLRGRSTSTGPLPPAFWRVAVLFYAVSAAGNLLVIPPAGLQVVADAAGTLWKVSAIRGASAVVSIFVMGTFAAAAWLRVPGVRSDMEQPVKAREQRQASAR